MLNLVKQYFKYAGAVVAIWGFGYWQFSPAWLMLGLVAYVWKEKKVKEHKRRIEISQQASRNEKAAILARVEDLPSWVNILIIVVIFLFYIPLTATAMWRRDIGLPAYQWAL